MNNKDKLLLKIFLYGLPVVGLIAWFDSQYTAGIIDTQEGWIKTVYNFGGLVFGIWMVLACYVSIKLVIAKKYRDEILTRLCFFTERDEREAILSGQATKSAFLTTLAVLILFFCVSTIQFAVYHVPQAKAVNGKTGMISLGLGFGLTSEQDAKIPKEDIDESKMHFSYSGFPISKPMIFLLLILTQMLAYNYSIRQQIAKD